MSDIEHPIEGVEDELDYQASLYPRDDWPPPEDDG